MVERYGFLNGKVVPVKDDASILVYAAPTATERLELLEVHGLDPHNLDSALDPDELGRVELDGPKADIILKVPRNFTSEDQLLFTVTSMGLFISPKRLIVVTTDPIDLFHDRSVPKVSNVRDALLKIWYGTISHFLGHLKVINMLSDSLEKRVNASMGNRYLLDMFTLEKSLVYFVNGISSNQMVLEKMVACEAKLKFSAAQRETLEDIGIENLQCAKQAEIYSNILTGLMDARGSVVNNNLNVLIKRLTIISVVFMPMNVLAGMGGMSEYSTWTAGIPWPIAYSFALLVLAGVGIGTWWLLKKSGIERNELETRVRRRPAAR
jgi:magnesium transporter